MGSTASIAAALAPLGVVVFIFWLVALNMFWVRQVNRADPTMPASLSQWMLAWWGECLCVMWVYGWLQPFAWAAVRDHIPNESSKHSTDQPASSGRGIVLVHGYTCNRGLWNPWMRHLRATGVPCVAVNLEPLFTSIDTYVERIDQAVQALTLATGCAPLLVGHSMGGLAARAWRRAHPESRAHRILTLGTPHRGTRLAMLAHTPNGKQMREGSAWLHRLVADEHAAPSVDSYGSFSCIYSHTDNIVFPASSATLAGAQNLHRVATGHLRLALDPTVWAIADELLLA